MASISQLSEEERNFTRFFLLNFKVSLEIVRRFFDGVFPPAHLAQDINRNVSVIINLNKNNRINAVQLDLLRSVPGTEWTPHLPSMPVGTNVTSSKDFDLTMMICLLRNLGGLKTPSNGWDRLPRPNETLPGADLATLKWYRNQMAHAKVTSMDNNKFKDEWARVQNALTSLNKGQIPHAVTEILKYDLDEEQAKTLAIAELEQLTKKYLECEKEKEQIESEYSYYKDGNLPKNIADANEKLVKTWITDDEIFYETKGTKLVYDKVKHNTCNCILVTSTSGFGKTATIRHIAIKLKAEGYEIVPVESPEYIIKYKTNKKQVFLIDDVLGKYDLSPTLLDKWERKNERLKSCLETEVGSTKILCTLRLQIALNTRFDNASTILNKIVLNLEDESNTLSKEEKQEILMKHLGRSNFENEIKTEEIEKMCENKYAFPLLCKLVSNSEERFRKRIEFFRQPLSLLSEELDKISNENKKLYCILVLCMLYKGSLNSNIFDIYTNEYDEKIKRIMQTCGLKKNMSEKELEDSARSAVGSFFTKDSDNFRFIHDALDETVGCHFYLFDPKVMLKECDIMFIRDRIRFHPNENIPNNMVIIREDELNEKYLEPLFDRLCDELSNGRFSSLLMSDLFKNREFVRLFGITFDNRHCILKSKHTFLIRNSSHGRSINYKSIFKNDFEKTSNNQNNKDAESRVLVAAYGRRTLMYWIVAFGCYEFFHYAWNKMTKLERKWNLGRDYMFKPFLKSLFPLAILGGSFDIAKDLILSGADVNCFSEFGETPLYLAVKSGCCKMVRLLLDNGAQVNLRGWLALYIPILATSNKPELTSLILEYDLNQTELHKAVRRDDVESLRSKLRSKIIDCKTKSGWTVLHYAVLLNNSKAVRVLLALNDDYPYDSGKVPRLSIADNNGLTAVHLAVINNNIDILSFLLCKNAEIKVRDNFDRTPLHYTTSGIATKKLLFHSSRKKCLENVPHIEEGREYDKIPMSAFRTMCFNITLHTAFRNVCRDFVNMPDKEGNTPLHCVINRCLLEKESCDGIETLIDNGANPYLVNDIGISAYALKESCFDTVECINNCSKYKQSIEEYHKVFALVMFFSIGLTFGMEIYISLFSLNRKEFQNDYFCVGQVSESGNINLLQLTRGIHIILPTVFFLLSLSIMRLSGFRWRMFLILELIVFGSFMILGIFLFTPFVFNLMYATIVFAVLCKWWSMCFTAPVYLRTYLIVLVTAGSVLVVFNFIRTGISGFDKEDPQNFPHFYTKYDLGKLNIAALNCTEFTSSSTNISCTSPVNTITYKNGVDFSVQCRTHPNVTNYGGTLAVEKEYIDWPETGLICLFCVNFLLNFVCTLCFLHCILIIHIFKFGKTSFLFHYIIDNSLFTTAIISLYWSIIIITFGEIARSKK